MLLNDNYLAFYTFDRMVNVFRNSLVSNKPIYLNCLGNKKLIVKLWRLFKCCVILPLVHFKLTNKNVTLQTSTCSRSRILYRRLVNSCMLGLLGQTKKKIMSSLTYVPLIYVTHNWLFYFL